MIITFIDVVCHWQHFLLIAIVIIIPINKIIIIIINATSVSHLSSPQPSPLLMTLPHQLAPTFFKKKETRLQANSVKILTQWSRCRSYPLFSPRFLQYQHMLSSINSIQKFSAYIFDPSPISFPPVVFFLQSICWKTSIRYFSILVLTSAELSSFPHIVYKSLMQGLHDCM